MPPMTDVGDTRSPNISQGFFILFVFRTTVAWPRPTIKELTKKSTWTSWNGAKKNGVENKAITWLINKTTGWWRHMVDVLLRVDIYRPRRLLLVSSMHVCIQQNTHTAKKTYSQIVIVFSTFDFWDKSRVIALECRFTIEIIILLSLFD